MKKITHLKFAQRLFLVGFIALFTANCSKNNNETPTPVEQETPKIVFTTYRDVGETLRLRINAEPIDQPNVWIDLNNNNKKDEGEAVTTFDEFADYKISAQTLTIYGKVTIFHDFESRISSLNVTENVFLKTLAVSSEYFEAKTLDISKNKELEVLIYNARLETLNVSNNTKLKHLDCAGNNLKALDVSKNTELKGLNCSRNNLEVLDVSNNTKLVDLNCDENKLSSLDVKNNTLLVFLYCNKNRLTSLKVDTLKELFYFQCNENQLTTLDVSNNINLQQLNVYSNRIKGQQMDNLINSLPTPKEVGAFYVFNQADTNEQNVCTKAQVLKARSKNWSVFENGSFYHGS